MNNSVVTCKNVSLDLSGKTLLRNISFDLNLGENLVVFGPNGAGKTLLLTILSGNLEPNLGEIKIFGKSLYDKNSHEIKKQIGFVSPKLFEDYDFDSNVMDIVMSGIFGSIGVANDPTKNNNKVVREYINRVTAGRSGAKEKALEKLQQLRIMHLQDKTFGHLSYGEKVRALIARSLMSDPKLFILDEPTTGLDLQMRAEFYKVVEELSKTSEIIYVTHHLEEILPEFDKILLLKEGEVHGFGNKKELLNDFHLSELLGIEVHVQEKNGKYFAWF